MGRNVSAGDLSRRGFGAGLTGLGLAGLGLAGCATGRAPENSLLINLAGTPPPPPAPPGADTKVGTGADVSGRITAPVSINGQGPFHFVVDTGANRTVVSSELAAQLGLPDAGPADIHGIAGVESVGTAMVELLQVDAVSSRHIRAPNLPRERLGADGLLGVDVLHGHLVSFDFRRNELHFRSVNHGADRGALDNRPTSYGISSGNGRQKFVVQAQYRFGQLIIVAADVAGRPVTAFLDSGSQSTVGNNALRRLVLGTAPQSKVLHYEVPLLSATGQTARGEMASMPLLKIGGLRISSLPTVFADLHVFDIWDLATQPSIMMGVDLMHQFDAIDLDYAQRQVVFYPPAVPRRQNFNAS